MNHIKIYERWLTKHIQPKIGDYVVLEVANTYGVIIDSGRYPHKKNIEIYLIEVLTNISDKRAETMKNYYLNCSYIIRTHNTPLKNENIKGTWIGNYPNYAWYHTDHFKVYNEKEKYDEAVEEIETKRMAKKYNL